MKNQKSGILCVTLSAVCFALGGVLIKNNSWNSFSINGFRSIFAFIIMYVYVKYTRHTLRINKVVVYGAIINSGMLITFVLATKLTTAANAIILQFTMPIFIIIFLWIFWKQKPNMLAITTICISLIGITIFFIDGISAGNMLGNIIAIVSGCLYAIVFLIKKIPNSDFESSVLLSYIINIIIAIPFFVNEVEYSYINICTGMALGIFQVGAAFVLLNIGLNKVQPVAASLLSMIEPVLNPIIVALFYGEKMSMIAIIGAIIVLGSATYYNVMQTKEI